MSDESLPHILIIEDEEVLLEYYVMELEDGERYTIDTAQTVKQARAKLTEHEFDVILTDIKLRAADQGGLTILDEVKKTYPDTQVIIFTGIGGTDEARQAERLMADGYLTKPLEFDRVRQVISNAIIVRQQRVAAREKVRARREQHLPTPERFIQACRVMEDLVNLASRLAKTDQNILIVGEAGTGKGLIAEGIHFGSSRRSFALVNCASLSERSLERIIFGHHEEQDGIYVSGLLERMTGGTLVLDRVSGLSRRLQAQLAEVLNTRHVQPHNGAEPVALDVRFISIDDTDLRDEMEQGLFSGALYSHLASGQIAVPPLRERRDADGRYKDVLVLAVHFLKKYTLDSTPPPSLSPEVEYILDIYPFPGNVSELEKIVRVALGKINGSGQVMVEHLPPRLQRYSIRPGLGAAEANEKVLCPHGAFFCDKTGVIANAFHGQKGVYLRLKETSGLEEKLTRLGMTAFPPENLDSPLTSMCRYCIPIQACRYAVVDLDGADAQTLYEVGLLHTLGVPTLLLKKRGTALPPAFNQTTVSEYDQPTEIIGLAERWLSEFIV